jgi:hypothetical protein
MLPTLTVEAVMPVWSLKALEGIVPRLDAVELPVVAVLPAVVVVVELVELQATALVATSTTSPRAAMRVFHDPEPKAPP